LFVCLAALLVILSASLISSQPAPPERVGPLTRGGFLLNSGWRLAPAGKQVAVDTFPMATALSRDGRYLLVLNGGYRPPSISVVRSEEHTSELQSRGHLVCRLLLEKKKIYKDENKNALSV